MALRREPGALRKLLDTVLSLEQEHGGAEGHSRVG